MKLVKVVIITAVLTAMPAVRAQQPEQEFGQSQAEQLSVPVPYKAGQAADQSRIDLPERYRQMWPRDFDDYRRGYALSNGQILSIAPRGTHMYARIDDEPWHKIVAIAPNTFVAMDRQLKMEINLLDDEKVSGWVTMVVPQEKLANGVTVPERVLRLATR